MKRILFFGLLLLSVACSVSKKGQQTHSQATLAAMPSYAYAHTEVLQYDFAQKPDGYWLFVPAAPQPTTAPVIVFNHGYGGYNPMIYGKWIRHLVQQGNVVIYPRYQKDLFFPSPRKFSQNAATGIRSALTELQKNKYPRIDTSSFAMVGHSYGGVISANLAAYYSDYAIPKPHLVMMCSPGTGIFRGGCLESYHVLDADLHLLTVSSVNDKVVGDTFSKLVFETATNTPHRNWLIQYPDSYGKNGICAGHNECYALDEAFDTGVRNVTAKRALKISRLDPLDYNGYWKLLDAALECVRSGAQCEKAFGNTTAQRGLGKWSDGKPIRPLEVHVPE